jgi:hypothetical protein
LICFSVLLSLIPRISNGLYTTPSMESGALAILTHRKARSAHPSAIRTTRRVRDDDLLEAFAFGWVCWICLGHGEMGLREPGRERGCQSGIYDAAVRFASTYSAWMA